MVLPRFQPTLGAYVYLLMHRFDEKDNSKPAKPTAHHDPRSRSPLPASGATPPPSGVGGPNDEKENSKPAKPTAHNDPRSRSPRSGATPPPSGGGGSPSSSRPASRSEPSPRARSPSPDDPFQVSALALFASVHPLPPDLRDLFGPNFAVVPAPVTGDRSALQFASRPPGSAHARFYTVSLFRGTWVRVHLAFDDRFPPPDLLRTRPRLLPVPGSSELWTGYFQGTLALPDHALWSPVPFPDS
jgi:hypothetical protein